MDLTFSSIVDLVYPIGSIYFSANDVDPGVLFGGTWEKIKDKFLLSAGDTYTNAAIGGNVEHTHTTQSHTLTVSEMPSHGHQIRWWNSAGTTANAYYWNGDTKVTVSAGMQPANGTWKSSAFAAAQSGQGDNIGGADRVGGGAAHSHGDTGSSSNMPPYLVVNVWKRLT